MINRRNESRDITDDSPAEPDHKRLPVEARRGHLIANRTSLLKRLGFLACSDRD